MKAVKLVVIANRRSDLPSDKFVLSTFGMESSGHFISRAEVKRALDVLQLRNASTFRGSTGYSSITERPWTLYLGSKGQLNFGCKSFNQRDSNVIRKWASQVRLA